MIILASKYRVVAGEQFLGHYHSTTPAGAIEKAVRANFAYHHMILGASDCEFKTQRGVLSKKECFTWWDLPELAAEFGIPVGV